MAAGMALALAAAACSTATQQGATGGSTTASAVASSGASTAATTSAPTTPPASTPVESASATPSAEAGPQLPRGGRTVFPAHRLVGYSGAPGSTAFGRLGVGDLDDRVVEIERRYSAYGSDGRQLLPVLELIATVAQAAAGRDRMYRSRARDSIVSTYLAAARRHRGLLLLNIQPGRADFLDEVRYYERWLREPDVGLALDPEWAVGRSQVPGRVYGSTTGAELDGVLRYVSGLVAARNLPEKVVVYHQLKTSIVTAPGAMQDHPGVVVVQSIDGIGSRGAKEATWRRVVATKPAFVHPGFKLFLEEDARHGRVMTPAQVLALRPVPDYVLYE